VKLLLSPWFWLIAAVLLLATGSGGYWWGHRTAASSCAAKADAAAAKVEAAEDARDANVEAVATATAAAVAGALATNRGYADGSEGRIRTVVVPGDCRAVDPVIVRELREAADDVNAALGVRVRPAATGPGPADP